jgi:hypothetical protein
VKKNVLPALGALGLLAVTLSAGCSASKGDGFTDDGGGPLGFGVGDDGGPGSTNNGGNLNDGSPEGGWICVPDAHGPGPVQRTCVHYGSDTNECDGHHDLPGFAPNGTGGNGFDDNCNGLVDEGCSCPGAGLTKDCYLVPASQTAGGVPVGWCATNSKGTVDCAGSEFPTWSGQCRGAQPPFADDICSPGDFNCDGKEENSKTENCSCGQGDFACPTNPLVTVPYPPPTALPLKVDGSIWFPNPAMIKGTTNWKWTLVGGDCDNILPHPTFAMFPSPDGTTTPIGTEVDALGTSGKEHGFMWSAGTTYFYPAFSLSGDYIVTGEFDMGGQHRSCSQKIQVRAPGIRAEACWDTLGDGIDLDLHMARVDGFSTCQKKGWSSITCDNEDCFYFDCMGVNTASSAWGYSSSPTSSCVGWGSQTSGSCENPRLDRDANGVSGVCDKKVVNPNQGGVGGFGTDGGFCGPENINVDAPIDGSTYAVGVKYWSGASQAKTHVNVYCDGARVLSTGYNPVTNIQYPVLTQQGGNATGDLWKVALIKANSVGGVLNCDVTPTHSQHPRPATDGTASFCVDNAGTDSSNAISQLTPSGGAPSNSDALCWH